MARILHIEDDPKNLLLVRKILTKAGHEVVEAASGLQGVRLAESSSPELVLVDINIPDLDGYEVTLRLRGTAELQGVPIVAITAEGDRQTSLAVGADGFIEKPIDAKTFARTVERFLKGHKDEPRGGHESHLRARSQRIVERLERKVVELREANARLEELARLRREFLQNVSHELATPMTPVVGYLKMLIDEELGPLTPMQRKCVAAMQGSTERLRGVVETLLDVSSFETGRMYFNLREYDVCETVARAIEQCRGQFEDRGVQILADVEGFSAPAMGDADKVRRAVVHVLDNAAKFTPRGGVVAVEVRSREGLRAEGLAFEIRVADDGPGLAQDQLNRVLEPFYQVDGSATRSHGGVGLGLAYARRVAETLGGRIEVVSPPNQRVCGTERSGTLVVLSVRAQPPSSGLSA